MIEGAWNTQSTIDARVVVRRDAWNTVRFHERNQLVAADIEEEMAQAATFFDLDGVGDHQSKAENVLIELTGLLEIQCRKANVRKSLVTHDEYFLRANSAGT